MTVTMDLWSSLVHAPDLLSSGLDTVSHFGFLVEENGLILHKILFCSKVLATRQHWMGSINLNMLFTVQCISNVLSMTTATSEFFLKNLLSSDLSLEQLSLKASILTTMLCCPLCHKNFVKFMKWLLLAKGVSFPVEILITWCQKSGKLTLKSYCLKQAL